MSEADSDRQHPNPKQDPEADAGDAALMYVRCSVCGQWLDVKPGRLNWVSHGLCPACHESEIARIKLILEERRQRREQMTGGPDAGGAAAKPLP